MYKLTVVRHGETEHNKSGILQGHLDIPLSSVGIEQARALAKDIGHERFSHAFSSDLLRASQVILIN
jgi:broad specificity phosphatase PhoE